MLHVWGFFVFVTDIGFNIGEDVIMWGYRSTDTDQLHIASSHSQELCKGNRTSVIEMCFKNDQYIASLLRYNVHHHIHTLQYCFIYSCTVYTIHSSVVCVQVVGEMRQRLDIETCLLTRPSASSTPVPTLSHRCTFIRYCVCTITCTYMHVDSHCCDCVCLI